MEEDAQRGGKTSPAQMGQEDWVQKFYVGN
jgi:hypothetical protein